MAVLPTAAFAAMLAVPSVAVAEEKKVTVKALYKGQSCPSAERSKMHPLPGAKLAVEFGGRKVKKRLDQKGTAELKLKGSGKELKAKVTFDGDLLSVKPYGEKKAYSYSDKLKLGDKKTLPIEIERLEQAGAASAWAILSDGVDLAERSVPAGVTLPAVTARYAPGRGPTGGVPDLNATETRYDSINKEVLIDSRTRADEFEPWVLLHEYGHHLLETVASPGPNAYGGHDLELSYPGQPALAWSEGFAHAFAAFALKNPQLGSLCRTGINLADEPATPQSKDPDGHRFNQYHEISVAGVLWALAGRFGGGDVQAGLKQLLSAFHSFSATYDGPESLREARDALIESGLEGTEDEHQDLTELFARHKMGWAFQIQVDPGRVNSPRVHANGTDGYMLKVDGPGPYGTCEGGGNDPGGAPQDWLEQNHKYYGDYYRGASGALDYAWQDDCFTRTVVAPQFGTGFLDVPYPAPANRGDPEATFTVYVKWICAPPPDENCDSASENILRISRGAWVRNSPQRPPGANQRWWLETYGPPVGRAVDLALDVWTPVVQFDALGRCTSLLDGADCGV